MGLLDGNMDPGTMSTLAVAGGLLSPGSFGQGLSSGIAGAQNVQMNAQNMDMKRQALAMEQLQYAAALRNQNLVNDALSRGLAMMPGGAAPSAAPSPMSSSGPSVMAGAGSQPSFMSSNQTMGGSAPAPAPAPATPPNLFGAPLQPAVADLAWNGGKNIGDMAMKALTPTAFRAGGYARMLDGRVIQFPQVPEGFTATQQPDGSFAMSQVPGGAASVAASSAAKASGPAGFKQTEVIDPASGKKYTVFNKDLPGFDAGAPSSTLSGAPIPAPVQASRDQEALTIAQRELATTPPGPQRDQLTAAIQRMQAGGSPVPAQVGVSPVNLSPSLPTGAVQTGYAPGAVQGANNAQDTMTGSYKTLMGANSSAQTVQARLDNIAQFSKTAILGGDTQWRDYANNLASIAGVSPAATDRKTAGDLIDKNASQISLAIGAGAQGTDALRSLAAAANPNRHMTQQAINEAVGQLQASAQVQQAKAQVLTPLYNAGNPAVYNSAEQTFDKNADYRVWQLVNDTKGMTAPQIGAYFQAKGFTPTQVKQFQAQKAQLQGLGVQF